MQQQAVRRNLDAGGFEPPVAAEIYVQRGAAKFLPVISLDVAKKLSVQRIGNLDGGHRNILRQRHFPVRWTNRHLLTRASRLTTREGLSSSANCRSGLNCGGTVPWLGGAGPI